MDAPHSFSSAYAGSVGSIFGETVTVSFFGDGDRAWCRVSNNVGCELWGAGLGGSGRDGGFTFALRCVEQK